MDDMERLTDEYTRLAHENGWGLALVLIDPNEHASTVALITENLSEATVCAGVLLNAILREGEPSCPHCLNNYRRVQKALQVMKDHPAAPEDHSVH